MIRACIFDLDGVIVDTAHYHYLAWKRLAHEFGHNLTEEENEKLKGVSRMQSLEIVLRLAGMTLNAEHKDLLAEKKNRWFNEYVAQMVPDEILPGVQPLIRDLKKEGLKVGLASSSKNARTVLHRLNINEQFDAIIDGTMIANTKPDPEIFIKTAAALAVEPENCVVIEDAEAGVEAAIEAGMKCIGIGSPDILKRAHLVFHTTAGVDASAVLGLRSGADF